MFNFILFFWVNNWTKLIKKYPDKEKRKEFLIEEVIKAFEYRNRDRFFDKDKKKWEYEKLTRKSSTFDFLFLCHDRSDNSELQYK